MIAWRYVELSFCLPDLEKEQFRCFLLQADSPGHALEKAKADLLAAHPTASMIEEFVHRRITDAQAVRIRAAMADGTWRGWVFP